MRANLINRQVIRARVGHALLVLCSLAGCAVTPRPIIDQPMSARPLPQAPHDKANPGAIFQSGAYRPLFEDVRARMVGDAIIITIVENTTSSTTTGNASSKSGTNCASPA